jgi:hypothetical protein
MDFTRCLLQLYFCVSAQLAWRDKIFESFFFHDWDQKRDDLLLLLANLACKRFRKHSECLLLLLGLCLRANRRKINRIFNLTNYKRHNEHMKRQGDASETAKRPKMASQLVRHMRHETTDLNPVQRKLEQEATVKPASTVPALPTDLPLEERKAMLSKLSALVKEAKDEKLKKVLERVLLVIDHPTIISRGKHSLRFTYSHTLNAGADVGDEWFELLQTIVACESSNAAVRNLMGQIVVQANDKRFFRGLEKQDLFDSWYLQEAVAAEMNTDDTFQFTKAIESIKRELDACWEVVDPLHLHLTWDPTQPKPSIAAHRQAALVKALQSAHSYSHKPWSRIAV